LEINYERRDKLMNIEERFRAIAHYATANGFGAGFPNFHQADHGQGVVYGVAFLRPEHVVMQDVFVRDLGNPETIEDRFRAIAHYATANGFGAGFPNFHQADHGQGVVYGVAFLRPEHVVMQDVLVSELGNPGTIEERFRAIAHYATANGFGAGFPNFHQADHGQGVVYGVAFLRPEHVVMQDVFVRDITPPLGFPISAEQEDGLGNSRKMRTKFTISNTGRITALTKTSTKEALKGFHGTVVILLTDDKGNILHESRPHTYGVDGEALPGNSKREEYWSEEFPIEIVEKIGGYVVFHFVDPDSTIEATLEKFNRILDGLVDANRKIREIYTSWQQETALVPEAVHQ
jgi:hypothetical protein